MLDTLRTTTLPNGLQVATLARPDAEAVQINIHVLVGSRNEPERLNGASHFIEHMLFKGTPKRSAKAISTAIEAQGGSINAFTDRDNTCYYARVPHNKARIALDVLADLFYNATFAPKELDRERRVIAEEIAMYADQPDSVVLDQLVGQLWAGHPLGRTVLGPAQTILTLPREELLAYRAANYAPNRTLFFFSGRVDHERCVRAVERIAGHLKNPEGQPSPEPYSRVIPRTPFALTTRDIQQTQLALGFRTPGFEAPAELPAAATLSALLGESMMSRLFQSIREKRGLCYSVSSSLDVSSDYGALYLSAGTSPDKGLTCAKAILAELAKLREKPVPAAELKRTRDYLSGRFRLMLDRAPLGWVAYRLLLHLPVDPQATLEGYAAVTPADLQAFAQRYLATPTLSVVAPQGEKASRWEKLGIV